MRRRVGRARVVHALAGAMLAGATLAALASLAGCGPIRYVGDVTRRASDAVEQARAAQAEKYAPYWWTRAIQYLHKAREVAAHADFQGASRFGRLATEAATHAAEDARIAAGDPAKRPRDVAPDAAPIKEAPVAPARDLPVPAKQPASSRPAPAREPRPRVAPAKDPP